MNATIQFSTPKELRAAGYTVAGNTTDATMLSEIARDYAARNFLVRFEKADYLYIYWRRAITPASLATFTAYAKDAGNWDGMVLVGGNVGGTKEDRGNLTDLKRKGLIRTQQDEGLTWVTFTPLGITFAQALGIDLSWINYR